MPLAGLLEEVAAAQNAPSGAVAKAAAAAAAAAAAEGSEDGGGVVAGSGTSLSMREASIAVAAHPPELGWEEQPSALTIVDVDVEGMKEVSSLQVRGW